MTLCKERDALAAQLTVRPARRELVVHPNRNSWRPDPWDHFCGSASGSNFGFASFRGWLPPRTRSMFFSTCGSELSDKARACPSSHEREVRRPAKLVYTRPTNSLDDKRPSYLLVYRQVARGPILLLLIFRFFS